MIPGLFAVDVVSRKVEVVKGDRTLRALVHCVGEWLSIVGEVLLLFLMYKCLLTVGLIGLLF